ncbi:MAG: 2,3-bisphosphoglycerate-independent phosphoglycerate mutase [Candidatus Neomarinimicrobiota bacterium]
MMISSTLNESELKFVLIIIDGLGLRDSVEGNAFKLSRTPVLDNLFSTYPWSHLGASGRSVGLPEGIMGNSEVGHLTIGSGRIIKQDLVRIDEAIKNDTFRRIPELRNVFSYVREKNGSLHLLGLLSDAGVHSHMDHLFALLGTIRKEGIENVFLHAITDGRDTSPADGVRFVTETLVRTKEIGTGSLSTIVGRYYAMDRDRRWERTEIAYRAYAAGEGEPFQDPIRAVESSYEENITDEFIKPRILVDRENHSNIIRDNDAVLCFNFRADRMRQIVESLGNAEFEAFPRVRKPVFTTTFTSYDDGYAFPVLFQPEAIENLFGEILENHGFHQLRVAETEKYAHVSYFFNGGDEKPYPHEDRILVPSPKVATYDLDPEMSAYGVREEVLNAIRSEKYHCIIMNLANPDMVGHTGDLQASIKAGEVVDEVVGEIVQAAKERGAAVFVTSDHGNCEMMVSEKTGQVHTAHTLNPVPFIVVTAGPHVTLKSSGGLADVSPTILDFLGIPIPTEMTGESLLVKP